LTQIPADVFTIYANPSKLELPYANIRDPRLVHGYGLSFPTFLPAMAMATPTAAGCSSWQMVKSFLMLPRFMASTFWSRMWKPPPPHKRLRMLLLYGAKGAAAATAAATSAAAAATQEEDSEEQTAIRTKIEFCSVARIPL